MSMKLLFVHANYINYKVKEKTKSAEEIPRERRSGGMRDPLIVFACAEKMDEKSDDVAEKASAEIKNVASMVKTSNIALFPFAHLSDELANPEAAIQILKCIECKLVDGGYRVLRVPFGWYKIFEFKSKGHPLSVLSRSIPRKANPAPLSPEVGRGPSVE
jgi:threonyl-tRNA synthetase